MSLLFETIRILDGRPERLDLHAGRMNEARRVLFGCADPIDLEAVMQNERSPWTGVVRCRIVYAQEIVSVEFAPYRPREIRSLAIVHDNTIEYRYKWCDRSSLDRLVEGCGCDDVVIVRKGLVTDSSIANLVFVKPSGWFTPSAPLLRGTRRDHLLSRGIIRPIILRESDIATFSHVLLINAMLEPDMARAIPVSAIRTAGPIS
jgi:4-amino-4-deoxychorismate lyase